MQAGDYDLPVFEREKVSELWLERLSVLPDKSFWLFLVLGLVKLEEPGVSLEPDIA